MKISKTKEVFKSMGIFRRLSANFHLLSKSLKGSHCQCLHQCIRSISINKSEERQLQVKSSDWRTFQKKVIQRFFQAGQLLFARELSRFNWFDTGSNARSNVLCNVSIDVDKENSTIVIKFETTKKQTIDQCIKKKSWWKCSLVQFSLKTRASLTIDRVHSLASSKKNQSSNSCLSACASPTISISW